MAAGRGGGSAHPARGQIIAVGRHDDYPGIADRWELQAPADGGMTPREVPKVATLGAAQSIGRECEICSLEPGKFADLVILERNLLADIRATLTAHEVMKNGRVYDAATLDETWPRRRPAPRAWFADEPPAA